MNIGRMIEFNRMRIQHPDRDDGEKRPLGQPVWGVYESYDGKFNQLIVLDQAEAEKLREQINERLIIPALDEAVSGDGEPAPPALR